MRARFIDIYRPRLVSIGNFGALASFEELRVRPVAAKEVHDVFSETGTSTAFEKEGERKLRRVGSIAGALLRAKFKIPRERSVTRDSESFRGMCN